MPIASVCSECHSTDISDAQAPCPRCSVQIIVQRYNECGHECGFDEQSDCDCWTGYGG